MDGNAEEREVVLNAHDVERKISSIGRPSAGELECQVTLENLVE